MERKHATAGSEPTGPDERSTAVESTKRAELEATTTPPPVTITATRNDVDDPAANVLTIIGRGTPSSFEITVDGDVELLEEERATETSIVSGSTVEGTIETGTLRYRFTGDLADVTFVDRRITGVEPGAAPNVHVDYAAPEQ